MPGWLMIQIGSLMGLLLIASFFYLSTGWRVSSPFKSTQILKFIYLRIIPLLWSVISIIIGLIYISFTIKEQKILLVTCTIMIPVAYLTWFAYDLYSKTVKIKLEENEEKAIVEQRKQELKDWARKLKLSEENIEIKIYPARGSAKGRLTVYHVSKEKEVELVSHMDDLPKGIFLEIISKSDDNNNKLLQ